MTNNPVVSIVIPVYNNRDTIIETLDSVAVQTYREWEIICVDDGSVDDTLSIINTYIEKHEELKVRLIIRGSQAKGGSVCRNIGAKAAAGEYLIFLDADDLLNKTCLEKRVEAINGTDNQFVVFPMATFTDGKISEARVYSRLYVKEPLYFFITGFGTWQVTSPIIRKSFFDYLGGYDESFPRLQDVEFHIRAIIESEGHYLVCDDSMPDCFYRQSKNSSVVIEKLKRTMIGAGKLVSLIETYDKKNVFSNHKKFSLSLISLYCHFCYYLSTIQKAEPDFKSKNPVLCSNLINNVSIFGKWSIKIVETIPSVEAKIFFCRAIDKIIRKKLAK